MSYLKPLHKACIITSDLRGVRPGKLALALLKMTLLVSENAYKTVSEIR